jgi:hypothetical protein
LDGKKTRIVVVTTNGSLGGNGAHDRVDEKKTKRNKNGDRRMSKGKS